jgi:glycosyltransferase involved in cell wall biosynthesis
MFQSKPNIAVFSLAYHPFEGGAEIAVREIIKRLPQFQFTVFTYKFDRNWLSKEIRDGAEIIRVGRGRRTKEHYGHHIVSKIFYIFAAWKKAEEAHRQKRFDVLWAVMASYGSLAALFFKLRHPRVPLLLTVQEGDSEKHLLFGRGGLVGLGSWLAFKKADYVQVISNFLRDLAKNRGAKCPIEVVPNGVDWELFNTSYRPTEIKAVRDSLGLKDEYVILTTSRLVFKNGIDTLIEAIAKFKEKRPNVKCLIIGDGPEREKLKVKSKKLNVAGNVIFLGQIPQKDLPIYFRIADVFIRPSRSEGLGNSFLEAMAAGVPAVGTPVGGIVDFLKDGETGFVVPVNDSAKLAEKLHYILKSQSLREGVIQNAKSLIRETYTWDKIANIFRNIFDRLINL